MVLNFIRQGMYIDIIEDILDFVETGRSDLLVCSCYHYGVHCPQWLLKYCG